MSVPCALPPDAGGGCGELPARPALARPWNQPSLPRIGYRIGTFSSFRRAMLDDLALRLPGWRETPARRDYATTIVELWAYVADVLTFYQEQIANEAYLGTATERDSLRRLAELVGYRPSPGAAATALVAFRMAKGKTAALPPGLRVGTSPSPGRPAAVFETEAAVAARAEHNAIPLLAAAPANQFASLAALRAVSGPSLPSDPEILREVFGDLGPVLLTLDPAPSAAPVPAAFAPAAAGVATMPDPASAEPRWLRFRGTGLLLRPGAFLLVLDRPYTPGAGSSGKLREIAAVEEDRAAGTTDVVVLEDPGASYASDHPTVYAFRVEAAPFGQAAPGAAAYLPESDPDVIELDAVYDRLGPDGAARSFVVLIDSETARRSYQLLAIRAADKVNISRTYPLTLTVPTELPAETTPSAGTTPPAPKTLATTVTLTGRVTRLTLDTSVFTGSAVARIGGGAAATGQFSRRGTLVLARSEPLELEPLRALPGLVGGSRILLDGAHEHLEVGQQAIVRGRIAAPDGTATADVAVEATQITRVRALPAAGATVVTLARPLANAYARSTLELLANVAPASHGETVREEILGSGNGAAWQTFALRKAPLTYLPDVSGESGQPLVDTLRVVVDGVQWLERPAFVGAAPSERSFVTAEDDRGVTSVVFGDGTARPPTGRDNVRARYRHGLGSAGAVGSGAIAKLVDSVPGLQGVTNPEPAAGAADPESREEVRTNAPTPVRTLDRAVSLADYAALALGYPGVAMARCDLLREDAGRALPRALVRLVVAGPERAVLPATALAKLRAFLDVRRDVNVPLRIAPFTPVYADLFAVVDVDPHMGRKATLQAALAALSPTRNPDGSLGYFGQLGFGQSVFLSAVYAALQRVPGVSSATVSALRDPSVDGRGVVRDRIPVGPTSLAVVGNDPTDLVNARGRLTIHLGSGGFED